MIAQALEQQVLDVLKDIIDQHDFCTLFFSLEHRQGMDFRALSMAILNLERLGYIKIKGPRSALDFAFLVEETWNEALRPHRFFSDHIPGNEGEGQAFSETSVRLTRKGRFAVEDCYIYDGEGFELAPEQALIEFPSYSLASEAENRPARDAYLEKRRQAASEARYQKFLLDTMEGYQIRAPEIVLRHDFLLQHSHNYAALFNEYARLQEKLYGPYMQHRSTSDLRRYASIRDFESLCDMFWYPAVAAKDALAKVMFKAFQHPQSIPAHVLS